MSENNDELSLVVNAVLEPGGLLAQTIAGYKARPGQQDMAQAVAQAITQKDVLVVEAGTGIGKTYAYLVPALLSGQRLLVSTATKNLQDQLFSRDLPQLLDILAMPAKTALLKGRSSYLCLHRLPRAWQAEFAHEPSFARALNKIEHWAQRTRTGDLAEVEGLDERSSVIQWVTSTRDNCVGSECPEWKNCYVNQARREALGADVVVVNHHLFFADMMVRESGVAELLPSVDVLVFDEAHQLNETGIQFLGVQVSSAQLIDFVRDVLATGLVQARGLVDWAGVCGKTEKAVRELRLVLGGQGGKPDAASDGRKPWNKGANTAANTSNAANAGSRLRWLNTAPEGIDAQQWHTALQALMQCLDECGSALQVVAETSPELQRLCERADEYLERLDRLRQTMPHDAVRWVELGVDGKSYFRLLETPLDIGPAMQEKLFKKVASNHASAEDGDDDFHSTDPRGQAWIFTSATLGSEPTLSWFTQSCGLEQARVLQAQSPFDYVQQAALHIPRALPMPNEFGHSEAVAAWVAKSAQTLGGRTLVLTTTLRAMNYIAQEIRSTLGEASGIEVLVQGQSSKHQLVERFCALGESSAANAQRGDFSGAVLVASASFWEGVDIPGHALQMVVIDKLPFPPPSDPLVEARSKRFEEQGKSAFGQYSLPEAAISLKQGAGRLIRRESDQGLLVICDPRLRSASYGQRLIAALPPMRLMHDPQEVQAYLMQLRTLADTQSDF